MDLQPYIVTQGDYLAKIAALHAFDADDVWSDPKNDELRKKRKDPDQLVAGDILYIPDARPKWTSLKVGQVNTFSATVKRVKVTLRFLSGGKALANERYVVEGADPTPKTTDGDGNVHAEVPVTTTLVRVRFLDRREVHTARLGHLDPVDEPSGARQRLAALGAFGRPYGSPIVGAAVSEEALAESLRVFQAQNGLKSTGALDDDTRAKLVELHGS